MKDCVAGDLALVMPHRIITNILEGLEATSYPGFEEALKCKEYREDKVIVSKNVITSRGPATAFDFAFAIAKYLGLDVYKLEEGMLFK